MSQDSALLTDIKVRRHEYGNHQLQLRFKGLSDVYVPHLKVYRTVPLSTNELNELKSLFEQEQIDNQPNPFYPYRDSVRVFDRFYNVLQFDAPITQAKKIQQLVYDKRAAQFSLEEKVMFEGRPERRSGRQIFKTDHADEEARWNIGTEDDPLRPGVVYSYEDMRLKSALNDKREIEKSAAQLRLILRNLLPEHMHTRVFNILRDAFLDSPYPQALEKLQHSKYAKALPQETKDFARRLVESELRFMDTYRDYGEFVYERSKKKYSLFLKKRPNFHYERQLSPDEWMNLTHALIDIETPKFLENNYEVCQVAVTLVKNQDILEKRVYSKQPVLSDTLQGVKVRSGFTSDEAMIQDLSDWFIAQGVEVLMAYNNKFDLDHLRERGNFVSGDALKAPIMDSSRNFFERFDIEGGFCLDLLRIAQVLLRGYPNAKLATFSKLLFGDEGYKKPINYQEMYELQLLSEGRDAVLGNSTQSKLEKFAKGRNTAITQENRALLASEMVVDYVCQDTDELYSCYFGSETVRNVFSYLQYIAEHFRVSFVRLLSSPDVLTDFFDQGYFKHLGVHRDDIYPKGIEFFDKERDKNMQAIAQRFNEAYGFDSEKINSLNGTFRNVQRRLVSGALHIKDYKYHATDRVKTFFDWIEDIHATKPQEDIVLLSRYSNALLQYLFNDFGNYLRKREVYEILVAEFRKRRTLDPSKMQQITDQFMNAIKQESSEISRGDLVERIKRLKDPDVFDEMASVLNTELCDQLEKKQVSYQDLYRVFWTLRNLDQEWNRVSGSFRIKPVQLERLLQDSVDSVKEQFGSSLLYVDYPVAFTQNAKSSSLLLPFQTDIDSVYFSKGKPYYVDLGWYRGLEKTDVPTHRTTPFESRFFIPSLDAFLKKDYAKGLAKLREADTELHTLLKSAHSDSVKRDALRFVKSQKWFIGVKDNKPYYFAEPGAHTSITKDGVEGVEFSIGGKKQFAPFIEDEGKKYFEVVLHKKPQRIYVHSISDYTLDVKSFGTYFNKKRKELEAGAKIASSHAQMDLFLAPQEDLVPFDFSEKKVNEA